MKFYIRSFPLCKVGNMQHFKEVLFKGMQPNFVQENYKLQDIIKQMLNESHVAEEAARIAKDALHEKEQALEFIIRENENLKMKEAPALDSIKEFTG
ncbi:hypothetical protein Q3G72_019139 [Acer saccharum]|nr:hypothetical protein Q3G72_019139 [Acer saccharum]